MAVIVGAGPAGASTAVALASLGHPTVMLERARETADAICGGFLSWRTVERLGAMGIDVAALGAPAITRLELFAGGQRAGAPLIAPARALSRRTLDQALTDRAQTLGAELRRGVSARQLQEGMLETSDGAQVGRGEPLVLATGKHEVRGARRAATDRDPTLGVRWRLRPQPAVRALIEGAIELHMFPGGYAGLVLQEDGSANLCAAVRRSAFAAAGSSPAALLASLAEREPALAARLDGAEIAGSDTVANVPYGWVAREAGGVYRVGDQAAVIPSLAGEGVGIAIASGALAAHAIAERQPPDLFQRQLRQRLSRPVRPASVLWNLAERSASARLLVQLMRRMPGLASWAMQMTRV